MDSSLETLQFKKKTFEAIMGEGSYWIVHQVFHILYTRWSMQCRPIIICTWIYFDFPQGWHRWGSLLRLFNLYKNLGRNHGRGSILNSSPNFPCSPLPARFIITCLWSWQGCLYLNDFSFFRGICNLLISLIFFWLPILFEHKGSQNPIAVIPANLTIFTWLK